MNKLLSIGIPTYNRKEQIFSQVNLFCDFVNHNSLTDKVELIIIDNNSDFNIFELFSYHIKKYEKFLKIYKNEKNIGMTKNLIKTMLKATGNYYYFIGDDDKPNFNSLLKGVELIDQNTDLSDVIVFGAKDCLGYRQIFKNIKENTYKVYKNIHSTLPIYYIGNACMFVSTKNLDALVIKENQKLFNSTPIPHSAFAIFLLKTYDKITFYNIEILSENIEEANNVATSWSELHTRFYYSFLVDLYLELPKRSFLKRHPIIQVKNIFLYLLKISLYYHFQDSEKQRNQYKQFLKENLLSKKMNFIFNLPTTNFLKLLSYIAISLKFFINKKKFYSMREIQEIYKIRNEKSLKDKSKHHWTADFKF